MEKITEITPMVMHNGKMTGGFMVLSEQGLSQVRGGDRKNDVCSGNATCNNNGVCIGNSGRCVGNGICDNSTKPKEQEGH